MLILILLTFTLTLKCDPGLGPNTNGTGLAYCNDINLINTMNSLDLGASGGEPYYQFYYLGNPEEKREQKLRATGTLPVNPNGLIYNMSILQSSTIGCTYLSVPNVNTSKFRKGIAKKYVPVYEGKGMYSFNYNSASNKASKKNIALIQGVTCRECYVYMGAQYTTAFNYDVTASSYAIETKLKGRFGVKISLKLDKPSVTPTVISLTQQGPPISMNFGIDSSGARKFYNLTVTVGAMTATVNGSGSYGFTANIAGSTASIADTSIGVVYSTTRF